MIWRQSSCSCFRQPSRCPHLWDFGIGRRDPPCQWHRSNEALKGARRHRSSHLGWCKHPRANLFPRLVNATTVGIGGRASISPDH